MMEVLLEILEADGDLEILTKGVMCPHAVLGRTMCDGGFKR